MALSNALRPPIMIDFTLQAGCVGQLPDIFRIGPGDAAAVAEAIAPAEPEVTIPDSAPESFARSRPAAACNSNMSTKYMRCILRSLPNLRQFQRAAQIRPRAARVDQRAKPYSRVNIIGESALAGRLHRCGETALSDRRKEWGCGQQFKERSPAAQVILKFMSDNTMFLSNQEKYGTQLRIGGPHSRQNDCGKTWVLTRHARGKAALRNRWSFPYLEDARCQFFVSGRKEVSAHHLTCP